MKTLANCTPREFLAQTVKIKRSVNKWLTDTDILNIRKNGPKIDEQMSDKEKMTLIFEQAKENINKMIDAIAERHADETLELLALLCFVEPENVDDHPMREYMESIMQMLEDKTVMGFFMSLASLAKPNTSKR